MGLKKQLWLWIGAMSLALTLSLAITTHRAEAAGATCRPSNFSRKPFWTNSGFWNQSDLVLLDARRRNLLRYSADGWVQRDVPGPLSKRLGDLYPLSVAQRDDGRIVLHGEYNRFQVLTPKYVFENSVDVFARPTGDGATIERIYSWAPTSSPPGGDIVAFADLKNPGERWSTGIVRFPLESAPNTKGQVLMDLSVNDASRKFHRLGYPFIVSRKNDAYVLLMGNGFRLWKSTGQGRFAELPGFNRSFPVKEAPVLPSFVRPEDYTDIMSEVEKAEMPAGLYSWEGSLYLVWRKPQNGGTQWLLSKIRPSDGVVLGIAVIPSRASHLFAVPGREWAFIEKGPALGLTHQEVSGFVTVPSVVISQVLDRSEKLGVNQPALNLCP